MTQLSTREMTRRALSVAWPAMMESFFVTLAGMIDTMMVSALGSSAVAAVGLTNQPKFIGLTLFFGINVAVSALVARRKGEQRQESANEIKKTRLTYGTIAVQLSKKNTRFQYKIIKTGARAAEYESAIEWLVSAGLLSRIYRAEQIIKPLEN